MEDVLLQLSVLYGPLNWEYIVCLFAYKNIDVSEKTACPNVSVDTGRYLKCIDESL